MLAEIITIGDEILIGQITDTNSPWIAIELNKIGISVYQITSISDEKNHILSALKEAVQRADIIIITGGLGPTNDDITKITLTEYFEDELVLNEEVEHQIKQMFEKINYPFTDINRMQAFVPSKCMVLKNDFGTAPGMWFNSDKKVIISLPGIPTEMKGLMSVSVLPKLQKEFDLPFIIHKTISTYGMGESMLADLIKDWENQLPNFIKLAYLPNFGKVRLRLSAKGADFKMLLKDVQNQVNQLIPIIKHIYIGEETDTIEADLANYFTKNKLTLSVAESVTGGNIAKMITSIPGASQYFKGGLIVYSQESKENILNINPELIDKYSTVSKEVAESMALEVQKLLKSDYAIATTGNAGPTTELNSKEVGQVFIAVATPKNLIVEEFNFGNSREKTIQRASNKAFEMLRKEILKNNENSL
ncbi:MAG: competence/damage-inducible protein A [Flavobacteriaceae bacterium]|nr:competence/damage-inducible protein A [Flavobacteriaceae bacterium]